MHDDDSDRTPDNDRDGGEEPVDAKWTVVPAVLCDPSSSPESALAVLMMAGASEATAHIRGPQPGAEVVDVTIRQFLRRGFALISTLDRAALCALPELASWCATLDRHTRTLLLREHGVLVYSGQLRLELPPNWYQALWRRGSMSLLIASDVPATGTFMASLDNARLAGNLVGATIPLAP